MQKSGKFFNIFFAILLISQFCQRFAAGKHIFLVATVRRIEMPRVNKNQVGAVGKHIVHIGDIVGVKSSTMPVLNCDTSSLSSE